MVKLRYGIIISFALLGFGSTMAYGQGISKQSRNKVDSLLNQYALAYAPGYSMAIINNKSILYERYEGFRDVENKLLATRFTNYRLASVTKQFTALAILQLNKAKKLSLEDDIQKYLPSLPSYAKSIKIKHLLNHIGGLLDYEDLMEGYLFPVVDVDVVKILSKIDSVKFPAGTKYDYSNSGYSLLASIIEKVSGQTYPDYITTHIFKPLKMNNSSFNKQGLQIAERAYGYTKKGNIFEKTDQSTSSYVLGDGGIYSSINDLVKWQNSLLKSTLIKENPLQQAISNSYNVGSNDIYACGWRVTNKHNVQIFAHTGSSRGFLTYHIFVPEKKLGLIFLTNRTGSDVSPGKIGDDLIEILLSQ